MKSDFYSQLFGVEISEHKTDPQLRELRIKLENDLAQIPEDERRAVSLYYGFEDGYQHTQKEIAAAMGVSQSTVIRLIKRSFSSVRKNIYERAKSTSKEPRPKPPDNERAAATDELLRYIFEYWKSKDD